MKEDKSSKKEKKEEELKKEEKDIFTSSREKAEAKPKLKAKLKLKKRKYPIVLVADNYIVYKGDKGNVWVRISDTSKYKVLEEYEV